MISQPISTFESEQQVAPSYLHTPCSSHTQYHWLLSCKGHSRNRIFSALDTWLWQPGRCPAGWKSPSQPRDLSPCPVGKDWLSPGAARFMGAAFSSHFQAVKPQLLQPIICRGQPGKTVPGASAFPAHRTNRQVQPQQGWVRNYLPGFSCSNAAKEAVSHLPCPWSRARCIISHRYLAKAPLPSKIFCRYPFSRQ